MSLHIGYKGGLVLVIRCSCKNYVVIYMSVEHYFLRFNFIYLGHGSTKCFISLNLFSTILCNFAICIYIVFINTTVYVSKSGKIKVFSIEIVYYFSGYYVSFLVPLYFTMSWCPYKLYIFIRGRNKDTDFYS